MDAMKFIFLAVTLVLTYAENIDDFHKTCPELWRLNRFDDEPALVSFTNGTLSGKYTYLMWHWRANHSGHWETSLWTSYESEKLLGNAALRDINNNVTHSVVWRLHNGTLMWSYFGNKLNESNWTISVCKQADWSFTSEADGNWVFHLGDIVLYQPYGTKMIAKPDPVKQVVQEAVTGTVPVPGSAASNQPADTMTNVIPNPQQ